MIQFGTPESTLFGTSIRLLSKNDKNIGRVVKYADKVLKTNQLSLTIDLNRFYRLTPDDLKLLQFKVKSIRRIKNGN